MDPSNASTSLRYLVEREPRHAEAPPCRVNGVCCAHGSTRSLALALARLGPVRPSDLARAAQTSYVRAHSVLRDATRAGRMVKLAPGLFALAGVEDK